MADEEQFGQIAVRLRMISAENLEHCMAVQEQSTLGQRRTLGDVLVEEGFVTSIQIEMILEEQQRRQDLRKLGLHTLQMKLGVAAWRAGRGIAAPLVLEVKISSVKRSYFSHAVC